MLSIVINFIRKLAKTNANRLLTIFVSWVDYRQFAARLYDIRSELMAQGVEHEYLYKLEADGICIVPDFWDDNKCAQARAEVDRIISQHQRSLHSVAKADQRIYGANNVSTLIDSFARHSSLERIASAYNQEVTRSAFTLAARMPVSSDNLGSGEGWHRDAFFRQFKAIIYLSDVGEENGPFQFIKDSYKPRQVCLDIWKAGLGYMQYRLSESEVDKIIDGAADRLKTYPAKAGTLILVDTSSIHRGMPIRLGTRYALTNYYFPEQHIDAALLEKFKVLTSASNE